MKLKNVDIDDFGLVFLSSVRAMLGEKIIKKNNIKMLQKIYEKNRKYFSKRDIYCCLEDILKGNHLFCADEKELEKCADLFYLLMKDAAIIKMDRHKKTKIDDFVLYLVFDDLNCYHLNKVDKDNIVSQCSAMFDIWNNNLEREADESDIGVIDITQAQLDMLCLQSFHYAIGRRTYMPDVVSGFINTHKEKISSNVIEQIKQHIIYLKEKDDNSDSPYKALGDTCDRETWLRLLRNLR